MSTVKITDLPTISTINSNTANTVLVGVDIPTNITGKMTLTTLAAGLYSNNNLVVGNNYTLLPNVVGQFTGNSTSYIQVNIENQTSSGSGDFVVTADDGTDSNHYIDMGFNGSTYSDPAYSALKAHDGYLYVASSGTNKGNLTIGSTNSTGRVNFVVGGLETDNIVGYFDSSGIWSGSINSLIAANGVSANAVINSRISSNVATLRGEITSNISAANAFTQAAFNKANTAVQNAPSVSLIELVLTGNLIANSVNQGIFANNFRANTATFSQDLTVSGTLRANTTMGNVFFSNIMSITSTANSIQWFPQTISPTQTPGQVWYSANTISLVQDTDVVGDRPAISKVLFERVYNNTGSTIPNNSWVKLAGGVTANAVPYVQLADATSAANSQVEGFIKVGIAASSYGFVYTRGIVDGINASNFGNNGELLFLSTTPGQATNSAPAGANSVVSVAKILSNGSANGKLQIAIANQQAYGKPNGAILFANNNLIQASNTAYIDEANSTFYVPNGIVYNQRTYAGAQTAITLNFTSDTWVRANVTTNMAVTLANFRAGSDIVLIVTNTSSGGGSAHVITHGCSALNSSVGATTFTLSGQTTAIIRYFSLDGDLASTFAQVSYS